MMTPLANVCAYLRTNLRACGAILGAAVLFSACSSKPPVPDWQMNAQASVGKATAAYLSGHARVEKLEWDRARAEIARAGADTFVAGSAIFNAPDYAEVIARMRAAVAART